MAAFVEPLETRAMLSATTPAAVTALRADLAALGAPVPAIRASFNVALGTIRNELRLFDTKTDLPLMAAVNTAFQTDSTALFRDVKYAKLLLAKDAGKLMADDAAAAHHLPNATRSARVSADVTLFQGQASSMVTVFAADAQALGTDYGTAIAALTKAHAIDQTLAVDAGSLSASVFEGVRLIQASAGHIADTDAPHVVAALDPARDPSLAA